MKVLKVDGGMTVNGILMQIQADVLACSAAPDYRGDDRAWCGLCGRFGDRFWSVRPRSCPSGNWTRRSTQQGLPLIGEERVQEVEKGGEKNAELDAREESPSGGEPSSVGRGGFCVKSFMVGSLASVGALMLGSFLMGRMRVIRQLALENGRG